MELPTTTTLRLVDADETEWKLTHLAQMSFLKPGSFYLLQNGKLVTDVATANYGDGAPPIRIFPRVLGGKGGFGSMLRAIGAQIEKTTNRDACRDLSGRRLRDINEEQRLKRWFAKQKQRDEEKAELKKKKLERLRQICEGPALPKMEDKEYNRVRAEMSDAVFDAVEKGFEAPSSSKSKPSSTATATVTSSSSSDEAESKSESDSGAADGGVKRDAIAGNTKATLPKEVKRKLPALKKTMFEEDLDSDVSSSESEGEETPAKKVKTG